jgi:hypothetical protein
LHDIVSDACTAVSNLIASEATPVGKFHNDILSLMATIASQLVHIDDGQAPRVVQRKYIEEMRDRRCGGDAGQEMRDRRNNPQ